VEDQARMNKVKKIEWLRFDESILELTHSLLYFINLPSWKLDAFLHRPVVWAELKKELAYVCVCMSL